MQEPIAAILFAACVALIGFLIDRVFFPVLDDLTHEEPEDGKEWYYFPTVPDAPGLYFTWNKFEERKKYWTGEAWKYNREDKAICYYQACDFIGVSEKVSK